MREEFTKGIQELRTIETPCSWEDFYQMATETLPGYVFIGQREYDKAAHYGFYKLSVYAYEDETQEKCIGMDTFQVWLEDNPEGGQVIVGIR